MDKIDKQIVHTTLFWCTMLGLLFVVALSGCEVIREVILDPDGVPTGVETVVVEGPGGDMVSVGHQVIERLAPLMPEPWNTLLTALAGGFTAVAGTWVFRNRKKK